jgi:hypothetical protein
MVITTALCVDNSPSIFNSQRSASCEKREYPREIIIEQLNSFYSKSDDLEENKEDISKYLNNFNTNQDCNSLLLIHLDLNPIVHLSTSPDQCKNSDCEERRLMKVNQLKRNSTVKEFRKQKLIDSKPKVSHEPQSVIDHKMMKKKNKKSKGKGFKKRLRDLSQGNQIVYKGTKGFHIIKKYRYKRRQESCQQREKSLGRNQFHGSVRSRNKSSDGFFSSIRSCSSD